MKSASAQIRVRNVEGHYFILISVPGEMPEAYHVTESQIETLMRDCAATIKHEAPDIE